jgi:hypothetical protein
MPLLFWIVPYIIAGGVMWFVANLNAPFGQEIKLSQAIAAVILMGICSVASTIWLMPIIGYWHLLVLLIVWPLIVMPVLRLSFRRSLLAVIIYMVVMIGAQIGMALIIHLDPAHLHHN